VSAASPTARTRSGSHRGRFLWLLAGLLFVLAGCAAPGKVKDYNDTVESNFVDKCVEANDGKDTQARDRCTCWYGKIKEKYSYEDFKKLDRDLKAAVDDGSLRTSQDLQKNFKDYYDLVTSTDCNKAGPSAPTTTAAS
jgi:hypothetical protein